MELAAGTFGSPGMVMMSPQTTTTNSAPADSLTSRIGMVNPVGEPLASALVEKLYWVLATQIGNLPKPSFSSAVDFARDGARLLPQRHVVGIKRLEFALLRFHGAHHSLGDLDRTRAA